MDERHRASKGLGRDLDPACSLKNPNFSVQQFLPRISFPESTHFGPALLWKSCVWNGSWGRSPGAVLSKASLRKLYSAGVSYSICFPSVYRQLYWFSLGKSLTWLPRLTPFVDTSLECSSSHPHCNPCSCGQDGSNSRDRGFCWATCRWFPLACFGNWGLIICYLHAVCTGHVLNACHFLVRKVDGKWGIGRFCPFHLSLRMLYFRGVLY